MPENKIITRHDNQNGYSWLTIEENDKGERAVFVGNLDGIHKARTHFSADHAYIQEKFDWNIDFAQRTGEAVAKALATLKNDPEALQRMRDHHAPKN